MELNKDKHDVTAGDILQLKFVKSTLSVNPCMVSMSPKIYNLYNV